MAPTEVLAKQHYASITELFEEYDIPLNVELLTGSMTAKEKRESYERIASGEADIIVGTHALIQDKVEYKNLALVVTDEQHRFGVKQREKLAEKGQTPHILVMSATPIPRTLAIILYGDLDISVIDELPANRLPIKNCVVNQNYRQTAYKFMQDEIRKGHQIYIICPMAEPGVMEELENVLGIRSCPMNWPIGSGKNFKGVYDREEKCVVTFSDTQKGTKEGETKRIPVEDKETVLSLIGEAAMDKLNDDIELLDIASAEFDLEQVRCGKLTPVFFGSALIGTIVIHAKQEVINKQTNFFINTSHILYSKNY